MLIPWRVLLRDKLLLLVSGEGMLGFSASSKMLPNCKLGICSSPQNLREDEPI